MEQLSYILLNIKKDFYTENYFIDCLHKKFMERCITIVNAFPKCLKICIKIKWWVFWVLIITFNI